MKKTVSTLFGEVHLSGKTPSHMLYRKRGKQFLITGDCSADDTYRFDITEYESDKTPKGDRKFSIELDIDALDNFLQILKLQRRAL